MANMEFLKMLAKEFPNHRAVNTEIINLNAIMALPKGTEYFLSDIHGEYDAFQYFVRSASGTIRMKIDENLKDLSECEKEQLAALIYDPENEIKRREKSEKDFDGWTKKILQELLVICRSVSTKYTRAKVRRLLPVDSGYAMSELLFSDDADNRIAYYNSIVETIIDVNASRTFIKELATVISKLAVDQLHIIGDIYDRGPKPHLVMDFLMSRRAVDVQWGNHDVVWMGAACGNRPCIANIIRMNVSYNNFDMLEYGYGFNLRPLATFAQEIYGNDPCKSFMPHVLEKNRFDPIPEKLAAKMHKMIAVIQFKVEGQSILRHPEYELDHRLLLDKIDYDKGTVNLYGKTYELKDVHLPTVDPENPYELNAEEEEVMSALEASILNSQKLKEHMHFMFSHGSLYHISNNILLFHGCIPMTEDGEFKKVKVDGKELSGAKLFRYLDKAMRNAYYNSKDDEERAEAGELMWRLWLDKDSPLFGKDKMTTFERCFTSSKEAKKENTMPYYSLIERQDICEKILEDFGIDSDKGVILNGHVPVKIKDGESPIKGNGKLYVIDGGISKAYQKTTGIAGYTFIYNSRFMALAEHMPYEKLKSDGTQVFHSPKVQVVKDMGRRIIIRETDIGKELQKQVDELTDLNSAFKEGDIKETYPLTEMKYKIQYVK